MVNLPLYTPLRKLVHIGGALFVPLALFDQYFALALAVLATMLFIVFERQKRRLVPGFFRLFYRDRELGAVAYEPLAYCLAIVALLALSIVFAPTACYIGIIAMTVDDGFAALVGRRVRGPRLPYTSKTVAGSLAGFITAAAAGYFVASPAMAIAGAAGGAAAEAYAGKYDNAITAAAGFVCAVLVSMLYG